MGKKAVVTRTETVTDDEDVRAEAEKNFSDEPLFADLGGTDDTTVEKVTVSREDPDEGYLGTLTGGANELEIFQQWGGSKYKLIAKNGRGRILTTRMLKLAGEPVFMSEVAEARWRRANGLSKKKAEPEAGEVGAMSPRELMALIETKADAAKREAEEREERRRKEDHEREEKARREEREWRAQMEKDRADREERIRREDAAQAARLDQQRREDDKRREDRIREDEQRREKDHERAMTSQLAAAKESQEKNQQFFTNMLAMAKGDAKASADPMAQVTQILTLVEALKSASGNGGEPQDAVTALLSRLPETLQAAGSMVGNAIREVKGGAPRANNGGAGNGDEGDEGDGDKVVLDGAAATKVKELAAFLVSKGKDPRIALVQIADHIMGKGKSGGAAVNKARAIAASKGQAGKPVRRRAKPRAEVKGPTPAAGPHVVKVAPSNTKPAGAP